MISGSVSLPSKGFFSPFPHGTRSLSVDGLYSALEGGPPGFGRGFTCPGLLRIPVERHGAFADGAFTLCGAPFQKLPLAVAVS